MRKTNCLLGILLTAGALSVGALETQAAEPVKARVSVCGKGTSQGMPCASMKRVKATERVVPVQVTKTALDRSVCGRLLRRTCRKRLRWCGQAGQGRRTDHADRVETPLCVVSRIRAVP